MIGVVLAGGRSTRLGQDKVRLRLPGDGRDMLARTADLLAACTDGVVISCRAPDAGEETLALPGIRSIPDAKPGLGPLGGVWSALRELRQPILVLSCDLPFMDVPTLRRLIDARGARPPETLMTTFQQAETGFIEALVSIYEPACLPFFEEARARNLRQLNLVIPEKLQSRVVYTRAEALPFFNINFPGELEQARRMAEAAREQTHSTACHASEEDTVKASPTAPPCGAQPPGSSMNAIPPFAHLCEPAASLEDGHGRTVRYIRLSVTDRCNLRCTYCRSGMETFIPHESVLRYEEMEQLVDMAMDMGVEKVRLTGGEPSRAKDSPTSSNACGPRTRPRHPRDHQRDADRPPYPNIESHRLNAVNLSSTRSTGTSSSRSRAAICSARFGKTWTPFSTRASPSSSTRSPCAASTTTSCPPLSTTPCATPSTCGSSNSCRWAKARAGRTAVSGRPRISLTPSRGSSPSPLCPRGEQEQRNGGPARLYTLSGPDGPGLGRLGLISPLSSHFCTSCNRLRITSDGALRTCLFDDREYRLRNALRHPKLGIEAVRRIVTLATRDKPIGARLLERRHNAVAQRRMTAIGG